MVKQKEAKATKFNPEWTRRNANNTKESLNRGWTQMHTDNILVKFRSGPRSFLWARLICVHLSSSVVASSLDSR